MLIRGVVKFSARNCPGINFRKVGNYAEGSARMPRAHQLRIFSFPLRSFDSKGEKRSFKATLFYTWPWLHYREVSDSVICYYCSRANEGKLLASGLYSKREETYISKGFTNWKDACACFK